MRKPKTIKEMYKRFSELCIISANITADCKFLLKNRYWFAVPARIQRRLGYDWTIADIARAYNTITLSNVCLDKRKNWCYTYEKDIYRTSKS